ncbi:hypothetical protein BDA96_06G161800 [Sorghum bicolor]|uniref:Uncharacterized protein n=2 Tax=Sorghum bicolor TaxID=4558 RepID=A0A921QQQ7_SORBI|nr:hypothetical protein BDA96_06G161800 [Sorghum bicolor]OQU81968.1 hypothetical protein SORBI_3006G146150 [Sorghum bicolor]
MKETKTSSNKSPFQSLFLDFFSQSRKSNPRSLKERGTTEQPINFLNQFSSSPSHCHGVTSDPQACSHC